MESAASNQDVEVYETDEDDPSLLGDDDHAEREEFIIQETTSSQATRIKSYAQAAATPKINGPRTKIMVDGGCGPDHVMDKS